MKKETAGPHAEACRTDNDFFTWEIEAENETENEWTDYESDSTAISQSTETTESSIAAMEDYEQPITRSSITAETSSKRPRELSFEFQPWYKRLRLNFGVEHNSIAL